MMKLFTKKLLTAKKETEVNFVFLTEENNYLTAPVGELTPAKGIDYIEPYAFYLAFRQGIKQVDVTGDVDFPDLIECSQDGFREAFCYTKISNVKFPKLISIGQEGFQTAFQDCKNLLTVNFNSLQSVDSNGLRDAFLGCAALPSISFPSLTTCNGTYCFFRAFQGCTALTEIHFRADAQSTIENQEGYTSKFNAPNATIYFDL